MHPKTDTKCIKFNVDDPVRVSTVLKDLGIDHHYLAPRKQDAPAVMTAYYDNAEQAEKLLVYLVHHACYEDKIEWQQDRAHGEIAGWCELCEAANRGDCDGGCLINHRAGKHPETLFVRSANKGASSDWTEKRR